MLSGPGLFHALQPLKRTWYSSVSVLGVGGTQWGLQQQGFKLSKRQKKAFSRSAIAVPSLPLRDTLVIFLNPCQISPEFLEVREASDQTLCFWQIWISLWSALLAGSSWFLWAFLYWRTSFVGNTESAQKSIQPLLHHHCPGCPRIPIECNGSSPW